MLLNMRHVALPNEILDLILDFLLQLDLRSARPLTLVCRHWHLRLSRYIFACVCIDHHRAISFSRLLLSQSSTAAILPAIRRLHVRTKGFKEWKETELTATNHILPVIASRSTLRALVLSNESEEYRYSDISYVRMPTFRNVITLKLHRILFKERSHYAQFFRSLPNVKHVELDDIACAWPGDPELRLPPGEFTLGLVVHTVSQYKTNIKWTLTQPISSINPEELYSLGHLAKMDMHTLLRQIGPALRELDVDLQLNQLHEFSLDAIVNSLDLSHTPRLRLIRIGSSTHVLSCMYWVFKVLCGLGSKNAPAGPTVTVLAIRFASSRQFHLDRPFLRCLTRGLNKRQVKWGAMRRLHFIAHCDGPLDDDGVKKSITQCIETDLFPYHQQGLVRVSFLAGGVCACPERHGNT